MSAIGMALIPVWHWRHVGDDPFLFMFSLILLLLNCSAPVVFVDDRSDCLMTMGDAYAQAEQGITKVRLHRYQGPDWCYGH